MQTSGEQQRPITSCLSCRRRKVRCDHEYPVCTACSKGNHVCSYLPPTQAQENNSSSRASPSVDKVAKSTARKRSPQYSQAKIDARLARLEELLLQIQPGMTTQGNISNARQGYDSNGSHEEDTLKDSGNEAYTPLGPARTSTVQTQVPLNGTQGNYTSEDDTLLVQNGHTQFVSAQHWALLAEEVSVTYLGMLAMKTSVLSLSISFKTSKNCSMQPLYKMRNRPLDYRTTKHLLRHH